MLGFDLMTNFRQPYFSRSLTEFWRRWHISLSSWFFDYLYFPMGGIRQSLGLSIRNIIIVFLLCGLWHGAAWTFIIWGAWHGAILCVERAGTLLAGSSSWDRATKSPRGPFCSHRQGSFGRMPLSLWVVPCFAPARLMTLSPL